MDLYNGLCAACAEDVGPCEGFPCRDSKEAERRRLNDAYEKEHGTVGSYNMAPIFEPTSTILQHVGELEKAGRVLSAYLKKYVFEDGFNMDLCPEDVKEAMGVFGESS